MNAVPRAVLYARCSDVKQTEKELSIPAQLDAARAEAKRRGWEVVREYVDSSESARTADRPQFQDMIAAARKKPRSFEHIIVWKFSRFARSREDSVLYKAMLERAGVKLLSLNERIDDSPSGRMLEGMLEVIDEFYSANLAEDTARGMRKNASLGYRNGGKTPVGYVKKRTGTEASPKNVLAPDPEWAPIVQRLFRMALAGQGARNIAATLHGEGVPSPGGKVWSTQTVLHVLRNEVYTGVSIWGVVRTGRQATKQVDPVRMENTHEALVSRADFDAVHVLIEQRTRKHIHPRRLSSDYLLSGLVWCGHCGSPYIGHPAKGGTVHYYGCQKKLKTGAAACEARLLNQQEAESSVVSELREKVLTPAHLAELVRLANAELDTGAQQARDELTALGAQIGEARKKLDRLYAALEEGTLGLDDLAPRIREWKTRVDELGRKREEVQARAGAQLVHLIPEPAILEYVDALHALLDRGPLPTRKAFLRSWVTRIEAVGKELTITYTLPPLPTNDLAALPLAAGAENQGPIRDPENETRTRFGSSSGAEPGSPQVLAFVKNGSAWPSSHEPQSATTVRSQSALFADIGRRGGRSPPRSRLRGWA